MDNQATKKLSRVPVSTPTKPTEKPTTTSKNKTYLGKRKNAELSEDDDSLSLLFSILSFDTSAESKSLEDKDSDSLDDLDSVEMNEPRKKIQKVTHSNTEDEESVEKMKSEPMRELNIVQTKNACATGYEHTITLSDDGTVYSFGRNDGGELGLGHYNDVYLPTPIPNLPQINMISCGCFFTVCVDVEGFIWTFGCNKYGQLGTGNKTNFNVPQKLQNIPPVLSVSCGSDHTLMIANDENLWSCGRNDYGQLCHGDTVDRPKFQKTSFLNISKISSGYYLSLFQNNKGEIFACGDNQDGACGLGYFGHFKCPQITPSLIQNLPSNIVHFVCGGFQSLFLDSEGNVFSVGDNNYGSLGLGHRSNENVLQKIPNIPPIKIISFVCASSFLIDFEGNVWSFGLNRYGQLARGNEMDQHTPKIIKKLKDIQQISYGCSGYHFFVKNSQNQIFVNGFNNHGQLGTGDRMSYSKPTEINSQFSAIWRNEFHTRAKSARK